jgi:hypothetical protein
MSIFAKAAEAALNPPIVDSGVMTPEFLENLNRQQSGLPPKGAVELPKPPPVPGLHILEASVPCLTFVCMLHGPRWRHRCRGLLVRSAPPLLPTRQQGSNAYKSPATASAPLLLAN